MQIIHYGEATYVTGDAVAHAVIEYAKALARAESSDTVAMPFRRDDGTNGQLELLIGPASQIVLERTDAVGGEILDQDLVDDVMRRVGLLDVHSSGPIQVADQADAVLRIPDDL
jgi:hypothetical protein